MSAPVPIKTEEVILENVEYNSAEELDEELHYFVAIETAVPANVVTIAINLTTGKSYSPSANQLVISFVSTTIQHISHRAKRSYTNSPNPLVTSRDICRQIFFITNN
uniref:Uncharacterized protein n=1 Tax=Glossina pallidipes TaxID=7398 RepID=A0A1B0A3X7_GLOPL